MQSADEGARPAGPSPLHSLAVLAVAFLPLLLSWIHKVFLHPRPFYAFYYDPETIYFYDGLRLLRGIAPHNVDNPGTPLQLLSAAVALISSRDPLAIDRFRVTGYVVAFVIWLAISWKLLRTVFRRVPPLLQVAIIWTFFLAPHALEYDTVWSPELFYLLFGGLIITAFAAFAERPGGRNAVLAGAAIGLSMSLKLTYLAWIPAGGLLILLGSASRERLRNAMLMAGGLVAAFLAGTAPVLNRLSETARFVSSTITHAHSNGRGASESVTLSLLWHHIAAAVRYLPAWHLWLAFVVISTVAVLLRQKTQAGRDVWRELTLRSMVALVAIASVYLLASRHMQLRYLIPAAPGVMLLIAAVGDARLIRWPREAQLAVAGLVAVLLFQALRVDAIRHDARNVNTEFLRARVQSVIDSRKVVSPVVLYAWQYPEPSFALRSLAFSDFYWRRIETRYPNDGHYDVWERTAHIPRGHSRWDFLVINAVDLAQIPPTQVKVLARVGEYFVLQRR